MTPPYGPTYVGGAQRGPFGEEFLAGLGRCAPCEAARRHMVGQTSSAVRFDMGRDLTAGAVAFTLPLLYHSAAPKKWRRFGPFGNLVAVVGLYFATAGVYGYVRDKTA